MGLEEVEELLFRLANETLVFSGTWPPPDWNFCRRRSMAATASASVSPFDVYGCCWFDVIVVRLLCREGGDVGDVLRSFRKSLDDSRAPILSLMGGGDTEEPPE